MNSIVLTQIIGLEQFKSNYFVDFQKTLKAKYLTINCNHVSLLVDIDIVKNNFLIDDNGITNSNTIVTNSNIRWPIKNGRFESMTVKLVEPTVNINDPNITEIFLILQFFN